MPPSRLPEEIDSDKLAEAALAILSLTLHDGGRVWNVLTEEGERLAGEFLLRHFGRRVT